MKRASAPSYDLFKTIVTVILALILLLMLLRGCATNAATPVPNVTETLSSSPVSTEAAPTSDATETIVPSLAPPTVESSSTPTPVVPSPTSTSASTEQAATDASTPTPASNTTELPTTIPDTTTPTTPTPAQNTSCNTSVPSRLSVGQTARVVQRLNMRNDASITATLVQTNPTNTQVEIIGGPVCTPVGDHAYLWWQIRLEDGTEGWSAETQLNNASYFLEPVQ